MEIFHSLMELFFGNLLLAHVAVLAHKFIVLLLELSNEDLEEGNK